MPRDGDYPTKMSLEFTEIFFKSNIGTFNFGWYWLDDNETSYYKLQYSDVAGVFPVINTLDINEDRRCCRLRFVRDVN